MSSKECLTALANTIIFTQRCHSSCLGGIHVWDHGLHLLPRQWHLGRLDQHDQAQRLQLVVRGGAVLDGECAAAGRLLVQKLILRAHVHEQRNGLFGKRRGWGG